MTVDLFKLTQEEINALADKIAEEKNKIFIFDGPTGSGKTMLLDMHLYFHAYGN